MSEIYYAKNRFFLLHTTKEGREFSEFSRKLYCYLENLKENYQRNNYSFHWDYHSHAFYFSERDIGSGNFITEQFVNIATWIYQNGCSLEGNFYYQNNFFTEYIEARRNYPCLVHYIYFDENKNLDPITHLEESVTKIQQMHKSNRGFRVCFYFFLTISFVGSFFCFNYQ